MRWVIGIDEAGYGPNLGPLSQAAVGFLLPDDDPSGWQSFQSVARRVSDPEDDSKLTIDDSKKVYTAGGFAALERTVTAISASRTLGQLAVGDARGEHTVADEPWYRDDFALPVEVDRETADAWHDKFIAVPVCADVGTTLIRPYLTATPRFNELLDQHGTKAAILMDRMTTLMRTTLTDCVNPLTGENHHPVDFLCDKLGGRHYYGPFLQDVFPECWPVVERETPECSRYRLLNLSREVTVTFTPRADAASVPVALASMVAKYLREVCMRQFNAYWQTRVPGLEPTAGYPVDAKRFLKDISFALAESRVPIDKVWRKK